MSRQFVHRENISSPKTHVCLSTSLARYEVTGAVLHGGKTESTNQVKILASFAYAYFVLLTLT